jgi:2-succinyl-5-enolpyruvyl-6-hydroxy-3-cyclohexene-1-carboxylate synthase
VGRVSTNQALAVAVIARLQRAGVRTFCLCPGGRNAPLVEVLEAQPQESAEVLSFFDERSAGFFASGRARRDCRPVAIVTTSGTAAAELLPAMIECYYSAVPIIAVTADRPRAYRRSGSPQAIEQVDLFGVYATASVDVEDPSEACELGCLAGPAHVNVCFSEPLLGGWQADDGPAGGLRPAADGAGDRGPAASRPSQAASRLTPGPLDAEAWAEARELLARARRPLVIAGGLQDADDRRDALAFCQGLGAPVAAEASSGIREALGPLHLRSGDAAVERGFEAGAFDSVIRIGDVPSFRVWRDLDLALPQPVLSFSRKPWRGLTRGVHVQVPAGQPLLPTPVHGPSPGHELPPEQRAILVQLLEQDRRLSCATDRLLASHPGSEPAVVRRLSETIPAGSFVYLGNSLPIREWNQFATFVDRAFVFGENRGANGIDGQVASFLGWARPGIENWAIVGDLTALYDLSALWGLRHLEGLRLRVVVINNGGGRIFKRMFRNERFQNRHATGFEAWATMWGADYCAGLPAGALGAAAVIELRPDEEQTDAFWAALSDETRR